MTAARPHKDLAHDRRDALAAEAEALRRLVEDTRAAAERLRTR